jgi:hypothetical protein
MLLRVGRHLGRTIYEQVGDVPSDDDRFIGIMDTPQMAQLVVAAVNDGRERINLAAGVPTFQVPIVESRMGGPR